MALGLRLLTEGDERSFLASFQEILTLYWKKGICRKKFLCSDML